MFLSRRWILLLISITGILFMLLLVIQYGWTRKSMELGRQRLDSRMRETSNQIRQAFLADIPLQRAYLNDDYTTKDFSTQHETGITTVIKQKVDSVLRAAALPAASAVYGRVGHLCYLMNFVPPDTRSAAIDQAQYKVCLCNNDYPAALDIGIDLPAAIRLPGTTAPGLVLPSVILIVLLIGLFACAIFIINRQKKLAELKNDFITNLTHEFNTPLFSIGITSNLLSRSEAVQQSGKLKGYVDLITAEKNRIQAQVDKILQLTAIEGGSIVMEKNYIDAHDLVRHAIRSFELTAMEKGGGISFSAQAVHYRVQGDKTHLLNALCNLLDNALKYSNRAPQIIVTTNNMNGDLIISVADNGIGMTKTEINMIFHKFYRVKNGDQHDVKGFGLGLSYVKNIVELHKGFVAVKSEPGQGSVFFIHLPYYPNDEHLSNSFGGR